MIDLLVSAGVLLFLDQWSKRMIETRVADRLISWGSILRIRRIIHAKKVYKRPGVRAALVVLWFAALVSAMILYFHGTRFQTQTAMCGLGAAFGGAAGNLRDILRRRSIIDFIDLRCWPVFNVADIGIVGGLLAALWARG